MSGTRCGDPEGATILNIPDTVGYTIPGEYANLITTIRERVPNIDKAIISVHCHDDLGLAVANTVSALNAGARQAEVTINGIGERAGNASLEEVVMALKVRKDAFNLDTRIDTKQLYPTSRMVSTMIGFRFHGTRRWSARRLCPRIRYPPARHAQPPRNLRDHDPRIGGT